MAVTQQKAREESKSLGKETTNETLRRELNDVFVDCDRSEKESSGKVEQKAEARGLSYLGCGCYRVAFRFTSFCNFSIENPEDYVLKVDYMHDKKANKCEVKAWKRLPEEVKKRYVVPAVMWSGNRRWMIVEYASDNTIDARKMREKLERDGYYYSDVAGRNMGFHDGKNKLLDYGHTWKTLDEDGDHDEVLVDI